MNHRKVLIVDDSEFDRQLLTKVLSEKTSHELFQVSGGKECLEFLEKEKVDLVLLDGVMPDLDGTQTLIEIRKKRNAVELPVIMITAKSDASDVVEALRAGANDYITKPIQFEVALSRISTQLRVVELSHEMMKLKEIAALDAVIVTYNHEINNPLSIALGTLTHPDFRSNPEFQKKLENALWRVADIVKKMKEVLEKKEVEFDDYAKSGKMLKVKKF